MLESYYLKVKMRIVVTQNAITRVIMKALMNQNEGESFLRIETRPNKIEGPKSYRLVYGDCNSNQDSNSLNKLLRELICASNNLKDNKKLNYIYPITTMICIGS